MSEALARWMLFGALLAPWVGSDSQNAPGVQGIVLPSSEESQAHQSTPQSTQGSSKPSDTLGGRNGIQGVNRLIPLADGVYAVEPHFAGANAAIILTERGALVVDTHGTPASARALIQDVRRVTDKPIRYVVNTHWHVDHHTGNRAYERAFPNGVEFIAHVFTREDIPTLGWDQYQQTASFRTNPIEAARKQLQEGVDAHGDRLTTEQRKQIEQFIEDQEVFVAEGDSVSFVLPTLTFERSLVLHRTSRPIHIRYFYKGHTRGDAVVYLPEEKILIAGDLLTKPILWTWSSYPSDYIRTLRALEQMDIEKIVVGHGPVLQGKDYLGTARKFLETIVSLVTREREKGANDQQILEAAQRSAAVEAFRRRFVEDTEQENAMFDQMVTWTVDRAYKEASGELP